METRKDILKELQEISPNLAGLQKKNPFAVPLNYFSQLDGQILSAIKSESLDAELESTTQLKALHSKENPFDVPYGYFERLPEQILEKVSHQKRKLTVVHSIREYFLHSFKPSDLLTALPVAAVLMIAVLLFRNQTIEPVSPGNSVVLSSQDIQDYLNANVSSLDETSITEQIADGKSLSGQVDIKLDVNDPSLIDMSQVDLTTIQNL